MRHTLKEYLDFYKADEVTLLIAEHTININLSAEGSMFIVRAFGDKKFYLISFESNVLTLNINEE